MTPPAPLDQTPEERALAQRLAQLGPRGEPSPHLDARVLAAARAALDAQPRPIHRSRRWPVALGVAASLVLAVGVAWRLRPLPPGSTADLTPPTLPAPHTNPPPPPSEPAVARVVAEATHEAAGNTNMPVAASPPPEAEPHRAAKAAVSTAPAMDVQIESDEPAPVTVEAPPPPAPPQNLQKSDAIQATAGAQGAAGDVGELDRAGTASRAPPETGDEPLDAMPPATADAPGVRDAWLARIRALIDSGDVGGGRRSLRAFMERYPDYPLPEDLRALQQ